MMQKDQFYPDIETKYEQLLVHMSDKNRVTDELIKILKEVSNLQIFYSNTMDKLANSVSKLLIGKDPYKDVLIIFERVLASKSEESQKIAQEIKDDMIPFIVSSIDMQAQQIFKDKQKKVKEIRAKVTYVSMQMQRKIRSLYQSENQFKRSILDIKNLPQKVTPKQKQKAFETFKKKQNNLNDTIDVFNANIDEYMLKYTQMCQQLSDIQTKRKVNLRDAVSKFMIFEMNYIKNIQYNITRYMESLNKMEERLVIQDRIIVGGSGDLYNGKQGGVLQLAKLSNKNYIDHIVGVKELDHFIPPMMKKFSQIKKRQVPGELTFNRYHELLEDLFCILDHANNQLQLNILRQTCIYSLDFYLDLNGNKVTLLNGLLCHLVFSNQELWNGYHKRLMDKIKKQEGSQKSSKSDKLARLRNLLQADINFLKQININPLITGILKQLQIITERSVVVNYYPKQQVEDEDDQITLEDLQCFT